MRLPVPEGFIHAKVLIADGAIASVGIVNMDERSFNHNFEVNALIYSREVVEDIEEQFSRILRTAENSFGGMQKTLFKRLRSLPAFVASVVITD